MLDLQGNLFKAAGLSALLNGLAASTMITHLDIRDGSGVFGALEVPFPQTKAMQARLVGFPLGDERPTRRRHAVAAM